MLFLFRPEQDNSQSYFSADELKWKLKKLKDSAPMSKDQQNQNKVLISDLSLSPVHMMVELYLYKMSCLVYYFVQP